MDKLINLNTYPVSENLKALLKDKTTKKNIIFDVTKTLYIKQYFIT